MSHAILPETYFHRWNQTLRLVLLVFCGQTLAQDLSEDDILEFSERNIEKLHRYRKKSLIYFLGENSYLDYELAKEHFPQLEPQMRVLPVFSLKGIHLLREDVREKLFERMFRGVDLSKLQTLVIERNLWLGQTMELFFPHLLDYLAAKGFKGSLVSEFRMLADHAPLEFQNRLKKLAKNYPFQTSIKIRIESNYLALMRVIDTMTYARSFPALALPYESMTPQDFANNRAPQPRGQYLPKFKKFSKKNKSDSERALSKVLKTTKCLLLNLVKS